MPRCSDCKTGAHIRVYRVEVSPGVFQEMYECRNCGKRWKRGNRFSESHVLRRRTLYKAKKKATKKKPKGAKKRESKKS